VKAVFASCWLCLWLCVGSLTNGCAAQDAYQATLDKEVKFIRDVQGDLALAKAQRKPLLILYSQADCRFCHHVRSQFLKHLALDVKAPVLVREVMSGSGYSVGKGAHFETADAFYKRMGIKFFPTVVLYDSQLNALTEPLLGSDTSGFYGAYLDNAIEAAVAKLK
jgi:thioredoxin-related protein